MLDLVLSDFHFLVLEATFLQHRRISEMAGGEGSMPAACVCHCCACIGQDNRRWRIKWSLLSWSRHCLRSLHPCFGGSVGMASASSALNRKSIPFPVGRKQREAESTGCKTGNKAITRFITVLFYPALRCGCCWDSLEVPWASLPTPLLSAHSLLFWPPMLSTSSGSHQCSQPLPGGKNCATNQVSKENLWKGQF